MTWATSWSLPTRCPPTDRHSDRSSHTFARRRFQKRRRVFLCTNPESRSDDIRQPWVSPKVTHAPTRSPSRGATTAANTCRHSAACLSRGTPIRPRVETRGWQLSPLRGRIHQGRTKTIPVENATVAERRKPAALGFNPRSPTPQHVHPVAERRHPRTPVAAPRLACLGGRPSDLGLKPEAGNCHRSAVPSRDAFNQVPRRLPYQRICMRSQYR
jgi:hypothetical protein